MSIRQKLKTVIAFYLCLYAANAAKLTVPRILLPYNTGVATNYTLEVKEGGCYKWTSTRQDLVSVIPLASETESSLCTTKALVSSTSRDSLRSNAIVLAEDEKSGHTLRCDVVIDKLHSIEIVTTTRFLFLEDAPEVFEVIAKNNQGDTFSSLAGIDFHWMVESKAHNGDSQDVLRFLKFADSSYKTPGSVKYWEDQHLHGSMILMEGSKTGTAKVTVKPSNDIYQNVKPYEVDLMIVANLNLRPAVVHIMPYSKLKYNLDLIKQGSRVPIDLPSNQYYLEVANTSVAILDIEKSTVTARNIGSTNIYIKDRSIMKQELSSLPYAVLHVVEPSSLGFSISPGNSWSIEELKSYSVTINIFDRFNHPIYITENAQISSKFPSKFLDVNFSSANGTYHDIDTLIPGSCKIQAALNGIQDEGGNLKKLKKPIEKIQDITIYESVKVLPSFIMLPWYETGLSPSHSAFLEASGGTGHYSWMCTNSSHCSVERIERENKAKIMINARGQFYVHATDKHISTFSGSSEIAVQPVVSMKILPHKLEVQNDEILVLPIAMYGFHPGKNATFLFHECGKVPIIVDPDLAKFTRIKGLNSSVPPTACRNMYFQCQKLGIDRILLSIEGAPEMSDVIMASCYKKLKVVDPETDAVFAIGTSVKLMFQNGPKPWPLCNTYFRKTYPNLGFADVEILTNASDSSDDHKIHAFCRGYGESSLTLEVGNTPCEKNTNPVANEQTIKIACAVPKSLLLRPLLSTDTDRKCPMSEDKVTAAHDSKVLDIELIVKDETGRTLQNITSLDIKWYLSDNTLGYFESFDGFKVKYVGDLDKRRVKNFKALFPLGPEGNLQVTASIIGYRSDIFKDVDLPLEYESFPVMNASLNFMLVEEAEIHPKKVSVFNSRLNKVYLNITKGSGHFKVKVSDSSKAHLIYNEANHQIEITPLNTGNLSIIVNDLCLGKIHEMAAHVQIYGISAIIVDVLDKVEIGKSISALVEILNEDNQRIPAAMFSLMNLQSNVSSNAVSVSKSTAVDSNQLHAVYLISGVSLGQASFRVVTNADVIKGQQFSSDVHHIQVFTPLKLNPGRITLIVGASFQVTHTGGPQPHTSIEYSTDDRDIATVTTDGIIEAKKLGDTVVIAKSIGYDRSGNSVTYSQDKVIVNCVLLKKIKIHSPLSKMLAGTEMPLYATGVSEHETPFTFGTAFLPVSIKWFVSNDKVASLNDVYSSVGLQESPDNNFCVRVKAKQDGTVTVRVEITVVKDTSHNFFSGIHLLTSEVQIQVFTKLKLVEPKVSDGMVLLSPNSQLQLKSNRQSPVKVTYAIHAANISETTVATVNNQGILSAFKVGSTILLVTSIEESGAVQRLTIIVKVSEVSYMMIKPTASLRTKDWPLTTLPIGFTVPFVVTHHNSYGEAFDAVRSQLKYRASRYDLNRIIFGPKNNTLLVQVMKPGYTILKVWDLESPIFPDYVKIATDYAVDPTNIQLTVGDVICFGSTLLTQDGYEGIWFSGSSILAIHPNSGGAVALSSGSTVVTYSLRTEYNTTAQVLIQDASYISIYPGNVLHVSNQIRAKPYRIYIVVQNNDTYRLNNIVGRNCSHADENTIVLPSVPAPFSCHLSFISTSIEVAASEIFHSTPGFDMEKGMYYCSIEPVNKIAMNEISIMEGQLSLSVHLHALDHISSLSQQHVLTFLPAFFIQQEELVLSDVHYLNHITISATPAMQRCIVVVPSDPSILKIQSPMPNPVFPALISFPIELVSASLWQDVYQALHVDISCPVTKQLVRLPIKLKKTYMAVDTDHASQPISDTNLSEVPTYDFYFLFSVTIGAVVLIVVIYVFRCWSSARRGVVTTQPIFLNGSHSRTSSPSHSFSLSPSPQRRNLSSENVDSLSHPLRQWTLDSSPPTLQRRRFESMFK